MDSLDLNTVSARHKVDYGVPRIFHIRAADFQHIVKFDRNNRSGKSLFGGLNVILLFSLFSSFTFFCLHYFSCIFYFCYYLTMYFFQICSSGISLVLRTQSQLFVNPLKLSAEGIN
jgi:hypothetical protein